MKRQTLSSRVHAIEGDMVAVKEELAGQSLTLADLKGEQAAAKIQVEAVSEKLDLLIEMQERRLDRRNKVIVSVVGALGTIVGYLVGCS